MSISPTTLNVTINDIPLLYKGGTGPDIEMQLIYNARDKQPQPSIGSANTVYYPIGPKWSFAYASFYLKIGNNVRIIMPDGRHDYYSINQKNFVVLTKF